MLFVKENIETVSVPPAKCFHGKKDQKEVIEKSDRKKQSYSTAKSHAIFSDFFLLAS